MLLFFFCWELECCYPKRKKKIILTLLIRCENHCVLHLPQNNAAVGCLIYIFLISVNVGDGHHLSSRMQIPGISK